MLGVHSVLLQFLGLIGPMGSGHQVGNKRISLFLEFYPIVLSLHLWGEAMCNQCILFFTDIESLVHVIYKQACKDKSLMVFVRKLVSICLYYNIVFKATYISGVRNKLADALSRPQVHTFG